MSSRADQFDSQAMRQHLDGLAKPPGSLGQIEDLAIRLSHCQQTLTPASKPRRCAIFAADHGAVASGVSQWPAAVTEAMIQTIRAGDAVSSAFAQATDTDLVLINVGCSGRRFPGTEKYIEAVIAPGTRNVLEEPAMSVEQFHAAWAVGQTQAERAKSEGCVVVVPGELGIGNTTAASAITAAITAAKPEACVGPGAGANAQIIANKVNAVGAALGHAAKVPNDDLPGLFAAVAGLEIVAMAGFIATSAALGLTVVLDGFVSTSAAAIAEAFVSGTVNQMIAAHRSPEPGHTLLLNHLGLTPFLDGWNLRLGEGTGAIAMMPLLDLAVGLATNVASLQTVLSRLHA